MASIDVNHRIALSKKTTPTSILNRMDIYVL
jgi:hypothetical protein